MKINRIFDEESTVSIEHLLLATYKETINNLVNEFQTKQMDTATSSTPEDDKTMKCALYVRSANSNSNLQNQLGLLENFITEKGWEVYKTYSDIGSGFKNDHKGMKCLLKDAEDKKFDVIITTEIARISRDSFLIHEFKQKLADSKTHFITLDGAINTLKNDEREHDLFKEFIALLKSGALSPTNKEDETL